MGKSRVSSRQGVILRWLRVSPGTRHFVATQEMHAAGIPHRVLGAGSMQLKHSGNTPGPGGRVCAAIPRVDH